MVTNTISQLKENLPLRGAGSSFEISFTKWLRGAKTVHSFIRFCDRHFAIGDHFNCTILLF